MTGSGNVVTGMVVNGRPEQAAAERTLGLFLNTVPLRADLTGKAWPELVRGVFAAEQDLMAYRRYPLSRLRRDLGAAPFTVLFNYTSFDRAVSFAGLTRVELGDWWTCDRNSFPASVEIGKLIRSPHWRLDIRIDPSQVTIEAARELARGIEGALWRCVG